MRHVQPFDMDSRRLVDREAASRGIAFMERNVKAHTPFFLYYPMTQIHFPTVTHPDFAGQDRRGRHRRRDGRGGLQRRPRARRDRSPGHFAKHDRVLVRRQRRRSAPAVARFTRAVERLLQFGDGGRRSHTVPRPVDRPHSRRPGHQRNRPRGRSVSDPRPPRSAPTSCPKIARSTA